MDSKGLTKEQREIAKRATNLESLEYLGEIKKGIEDGKLVEVTVTNGVEKDKYEFDVRDN